MASKTTAAGSAPSRARTMSTPARSAQISSCSTAAARNVSAAQISGCRPSFFSRFASLPTVVVLPVPLTPTISVTCGRRRSRRTGASTASKIARISCLTRSRRLSTARVTAPSTAAMIRSVAATPISAEISSSSSASIVSTSTGRERRSGASARRTISSKRSTICCLVRERLSRIRPNRPIGEILSRRGRAGVRPGGPAAYAISERCGRSISASTADSHVRSSVEHRGHLRRDRQLDPVALAERQRRAVVFTPSATIFMPARISGSERPRASSMPTWRLRLRLPVHVSTRSPSPLKPAGVSRWPPAAQRQPRDFREAARDERRQRVVAEAEPFDDAGRDGDDVLQRAADLDADDVRRPVEPEERTAEFRLHEFHRVRRRATRRATAVGSWLRDFDGEARARQHDDRSIAAGLLGDDLGHPQQRLGLEPLGRADDGGVRRQMRRGRPHHRPAAVRRDRRHDQFGAVQRVGERTARRDRRRAARGPADTPRWRRAGQCRRRAPRRAPTAARRDRCARDGRRAPCPSCPRRVPRLAASCAGTRAGVRFRPRRARHSNDAEQSREATSRWRRSTGVGTPVAYRRSAAVSAAARRTDRNISGQPRANDEHDDAPQPARAARAPRSAARRRDALAAAKPQPDRIDVADNRREARGRGRGDVRAGQPLGQQHARRAFADVEQGDEHAGAGPDDAQRRWSRRGCRCPRACRSGVPHHRARSSANGSEPSRYARRMLRTRTRPSSLVQLRIAELRIESASRRSMFIAACAD